MKDTLSGTIGNTNCYKFVSSSQPASYFSSTRLASNIVAVNDGEALWVNGGANSQAATDLIQYNMNQIDYTSSHSFPDLPWGDIRNHCLQILDSNKVVLYGGNLNRETWHIDLNRYANSNLGWIKSPNAELANKRVGLSCGVLRTDDKYEIVVAAGGTSPPIVPTMDYVELLKVQDGELIHASWETGPSLPMALAFAASATTQNRAQMFVAGGEAYNLLQKKDWSCGQGKCQMDTIVSLKCSSVMDCNWTTHTEVQLSSPRSRLVAFVIPPFARLSGVNYGSDLCSI